ncbi:pentatricopeptide repeat-containing protein [Populus alba x Populus x berolinensis]|uniref:Pentatricopeptide repeat-containing protein n=1 Tax=Populus alba x Populus x berolinensis TaxID=444605 RepID=A0AAD6MEQ0_9ROSI|nr:pentatricopeptide repeat-containing protein [Populus alba x Populus x berolinensis]
MLGKVHERDTRTQLQHVGFAEQKDRRLRTGDWVSARKLFDEMLDRNGVTWACLISGAIRACQESMLCGLQLRMQIHGLILKSPYANDVSLSNVLISMYGKYLGYIDYARSVFYEIEIRNSIS